MKGEQQVPSQDKDDEAQSMKGALDAVKNIGKLVEENMNKLEKKSEDNKKPAKWGLSNDNNSNNNNYNNNKWGRDNNKDNYSNNKDNNYHKDNYSNRNDNNYNNNYNKGGGGGRGANYSRENPMNQINNALNNYKPSQKMVDKYGYLANLGPNGQMGPSSGGYGRGSKNQPSKGQQSSKNKNSKDNKNDSGKSSFLEHYYPNGEGPDSELIEMLEREVVDTNPRVSFEDIAELDKAKKILKEAVLLPLIIPDYFKGIRRPWRGVLLYGPPGTGKTMLAKALATQGKTTFFNVHSSSFASKWRGESEKLVRILFEMARFYAPTTIFIDEIDSLCSKRGESGEGEGSRRVKAEILVQMDGVGSASSANANEAEGGDKRKIVTVMAATNRPWDLDDALRRRFEKRVYIPLPNELGRKQLFDLSLKKINVQEGIDFDKIINVTDGYSGADISNVCREAALMPMRRNLLKNQGRAIEDLVNDPQFRRDIEAPISYDDFMAAIKNISKSVSKKDLLVYDKWTQEFSSV